MELIEKEVYFDQYCPSCKHREKGEEEDPCHNCLMYPMQSYSHKPINYDKDEESRNGKRRHASN